MARIGLRDLTAAAVVLIGGAAPAAAGLPADTTDARAIMEAVDQRDLGERMAATAEMVITDSSGRARVLAFQTSSLENRAGGKRVMRKRLSQFTAPADVRTTGLLTLDYDEPSKEDPQWVFLPRLRKSKRIAGADKANGWMGSDFSYADLGRQDPGDYDFVLEKGAVNVGGEPCWLVEAKPRTERAKQDTGYLKLEYWISKDKLVPLQVKAWVRKGQKIKLFKFEEIKQIDGVWTIHRYAARTLDGRKVESTTVVTLKNVKIRGARVGEEDFTVARMERGL